MKNIDRCIKRLKSYAQSLEEKNNLLLQRLTEYGGFVASVRFSNAIYNGDNDVAVTVEEDNGIYRIIANGKAVAFIEFGSGAKYGGTYPKNNVAGISTEAGSWSTVYGKGHYADKNGWWYGHGQHSFGNPPAMALYDASKEMRMRLLEIAKEVYGGK